MSSPERISTSTCKQQHNVSPDEWRMLVHDKCRKVVDARFNVCIFVRSNFQCSRYVGNIIAYSTTSAKRNGQTCPPSHIYVSGKS